MESTKMLRESATSCNTEVKSNNLVVLTSADGSNSWQKSNFENGQYIDKVKRTINERCLSLTDDSDKIMILGETLPLLLVLIRECGAGDCCVANYPTLAKTCRVSASTIKGWSKKLEQNGYINKQIIGPHGLTITLNDKSIGRSDLFKRIDDKLFQSVEQIRATKIIADNAFDQAIGSVMFKTESSR